MVRERSIASNAMETHAEHDCHAIAMRPRVLEETPIPPHVGRCKLAQLAHLSAQP
jgi:hypothetical protein